MQAHTDERGGEEHNAKLSQGRASAVRAYLAAKKVPATRMEAVGYGPSRPLAQGDSEEAHEQNRRVEFVITAQ